LGDLVGELRATIEFSSKDLTAIEHGRHPLTRHQSRWVTVVILAIIVILRSPSLLPSLHNGDEAYYGIIANAALDGGILPHSGGYEAARHLLHLPGRFQSGWEEQPFCCSHSRDPCGYNNRAGDGSEQALWVQWPCQR